MAGKSKTNATNATLTRAHKERTTPPRNWRVVFLRELAVDGNRRRAAEVAGVEPSTAYRHRNTDETFRAQWDTAIDHAGEYLEAEAMRRATEGVDKPVYQGGELVGTVREYSDSLMALLLKGARPHKYRDNVQVNAKHEHSGPNGNPINIRFFDAYAALEEIASGSESDS